MTQVGFTLDDETARRFDVYAAGHGGRSQVLRGLVDEALERAQTSPRPSPARDRDILIRLRDDDAALLAKELKRSGMTQGQWLAACIRRRLRGGLHFNAYDRWSISEIAKSLKGIEGTLGRCARAMDFAITRGAAPDQREQLQRIAETVEDISRQLREAFQHNDRYWNGRQSPVNGEIGKTGS